ncbi:primosomal protein N' [Crocosphaera sp.]|uniref:primosomal protein N' n=1 Tax=Crocosphaera sp. TaxID=2729996 RepID=UPI003F27C6BF
MLYNVAKCMSLSSGSLLVSQPRSFYIVEPSTPQWIEVLLNSPWGQEVCIYSIPSDFMVQPGDIVSVPFGKQIIGGIAIRYAHSIPKYLNNEQIKAIDDVITSGFFTKTYFQLLEKVADYYCTDIITVIQAALPPNLLSKSQQRIRLKIENVPPGAEIFCPPAAAKILNLLKAQTEGDYSYNFLKNKVKGARKAIKELRKRDWIESYFQAPNPPKAQFKKIASLLNSYFPKDISKRHQEILHFMKIKGGQISVIDLVKEAKTTIKTIEKLEEKGYILIENQERLRLEQGSADNRDNSKQLTPEQKQALDVINDLKSYGEILLHGVTGSGKTEVYLQAISPLLEQGKSALILVPEIGLTPQLTDRFRARFGDRVYVYHSSLSKGERYDTWRQMLPGEPQVIIGTRSAIFAPLPNLGLIILDEEHDSSFKQTQISPNYHARTVAKWRGELENCPVILGSATPSLETWISVNQSQNYNDNSYYLSLPERIGSRPLPPVKIVDMREELKQGNRSIFSRPLQEALNSLKEKNQQGILFVNRRGHSTFVSCRSCGYVMECPDCDVSLSYHYTHEGATQLLRCHYCNHSEIQPSNCPECNSPYFKFFGSGTQKVTQALEKEFPQLKPLRFDSDTTRNKGSHRRLLDQFSRGEADILVGTQMLTKGLDLAQVTLVGVVSADGLLYLSDYRAAERAFQTLTQVAGRAGRGEEPGQVIIQTYSPENSVIQAVKTHDYHRFINEELPRREELNFPPYGRLILVKLSGLDAIEVQNTAEKLGEHFYETIGLDCEILGPAPASIMRVAKRYRWQILLKFLPDARVIIPDMENWHKLCPNSVSLKIDIDPLHIN